jgi:hypothetical protein
MAYRHLETSLHHIHQSRFLRRPEGRLWVHRAIRLLKTLFPRLRPNHFLDCPECKNAFELRFGIMKHGLIDITCCILRLSEQRLLVFMAIRLLKTSQATSSKSFFSLFRMQKMSSYGFSSFWNIHASNSPKLFFKTFRRQIMSSKVHSSS